MLNRNGDKIRSEEGTIDFKVMTHKGFSDFIHTICLEYKYSDLHKTDINLHQLTFKSMRYLHFIYSLLTNCLI